MSLGKYSENTNYPPTTTFSYFLSKPRCLVLLSLLEEALHTYPGINSNKQLYYRPAGEELKDQEVFLMLANFHFSAIQSSEHTLQHFIIDFR